VGCVALCQVSDKKRETQRKEKILNTSPLRVVAKKKVFEIFILHH